MSGANGASYDIGAIWHVIIFLILQVHNWPDHERFNLLAVSGQ